MKWLTPLLVASALSACTSIDRRVEGWPQDLRVTEVQTGFWDVQSKCWDDMPLAYKLLGTITLVCTVVDLDAGTCVIYRFSDELSPELQEHEKQHCRGYAHDNGFQEYFNAWMKKNSLAPVQ